MGTQHPGPSVADGIRSIEEFERRTHDASLDRKKQRWRARTGRVVGPSPRRCAFLRFGSAEAAMSNLLAEYLAGKRTFEGARRLNEKFSIPWTAIAATSPS